MTKPKTPSKRKSKSLNIVEGNAQDDSIKIYSRSFDTSTIKQVVLPKFLIGPGSTKQSKALDKGKIILVFDCPVLTPKSNLYRELLSLTSKRKIEDLTIDLHNGLSVWKVQNPVVYSIDFGQLILVQEVDQQQQEEEALAIQMLEEQGQQFTSQPSNNKTEIVVEIDYEGIIIDDVEFWCQ